MKQSFNHYLDPGGSWVAVKVAMLIDLGIADAITEAKAHQKGKTVYIHNTDLPLFQERFEAQYGCAPELRESVMNKFSPIRTYPHYSIAATLATAAEPVPVPAPRKPRKGTVQAEISVVEVPAVEAAEPVVEPELVAAE